MPTRRSTIPLQPHEVDLLKQLYLQFGIPSDQYAKRPQDLSAFIRRWNCLSERNDTAGEILHYIKSKRKHKKWPTFGGQHQRMSEWSDGVLSQDEWEALRLVYEELFVPLEIGTDNLAYDDELAKKCERAFSKQAGRYVSGQTLLALLMGKRKRGEWVTFRKVAGDISKTASNTPNIGFGDIDQVAV